MTEIQKALLGDKKAAKRLTEKGVLLPCPFCGGEAYKNIGLDYDSYFEWNCICCNKCSAEIKGEEVHGKADPSELEILIREWNTRAPILSESELKNLCKGGEED